MNTTINIKIMRYIEKFIATARASLNINCQILSDGISKPKRKYKAPDFSAISRDMGIRRKSHIEVRANLTDFFFRWDIRTVVIMQKMIKVISTIKGISIKGTVVK